jgi:hypothetical protein
LSSFFKDVYIFYASYAINISIACMVKGCGGPFNLLLA